MKKNFLIALVAVLTFSNAIQGQDLSTPMRSNFISTGYWLFGDESGTFHNVFARYEKQVLQQKLNISVTPHVGINRKSYGAAVGLKYVTGSGKRSNFLIGPAFHTWVLDEAYYKRDPLSGPNDPPQKEIHQTTKGSIFLDFGFKRHFNRMFLSGMAQLGKGAFNTFDKKAAKMDPVLKREKSAAGTMILGVNIGAGYRF